MILQNLFGVEIVSYNKDNNAHNLTEIKFYDNYYYFRYGLETE